MGYWGVSTPVELLNSAAHDRNAVVNQGKKPSQYVQVRSSRRWRRDKKGMMQLSVAWSRESPQAVAPEEGDRESLGLQSSKSLSEKLKKKRRLAERANDVWQFFLATVHALWKKTVAVRVCEDRKIVFVKLQLKHQCDCWHRCFCSGQRNHIRWFGGPPETRPVMCNGATGLNWRISQLRQSLHIVQTGWLDRLGC